MPTGDRFLDALSDLDRALDDNLDRTRAMKARIEHIRHERAAGRSFSEIVDARDDPLIVRLLTESSRALDEAGARVRRTEALALHDEGLTMEQIAERFGVTRQRVSALLRNAAAADGG